MKRRGIGLMSGTSLDGIDVVIAEVCGHFTNMSIDIIGKAHISFDETLLNDVSNTIKHAQTSLADLCSLNYRLGHQFADAVLEACQRLQVKIESVDFIASHGQTIYHIGEKQGHHIPSTMQLGEAAVIAEKTGVPVVSNFRAADIAAKGQGAPLVPYADVALFSKLNEDVALHNLGGISNLTVVPQSKALDDVLAFDTGPANMMIDYAMRTLFNQPYDDGGQTAQEGSIIEPLLNRCLEHAFLKKTPPKSTGREMFGDDVTDDIIEAYKAKHKHKDIVCTLTEFTAMSIALAYRQWVLPRYDLKRIIFSGGGALNDYLLKRVQTLLPEIAVETISHYGIKEDEKEALAFIVLAHETLSQYPSNVPTATGAQNRVMLGQIQPVIRRTS